MKTTIFTFCTIKLICDPKQFDKNKETFEFVFDITVIQTISCIMIVFNMQNFSGTMKKKKREKKSTEFVVQVECIMKQYTVHR